MGLIDTEGISKEKRPMNETPMTNVIPGNPLEGRDPTREAWTKTYTGKTFEYCYVTPDSFDILDIAHSLARICRWAGHVDCEHYSVAEHSIIISDYAYRQTEDWYERYPIALAGLLHDAAEAYTNDIPRPYKMLIPDLKAYENYLTEAIFEHFGIPWAHYGFVKKYDTRIMANESHLVRGAAHEFKHVIPLDDGNGKAEELYLLSASQAEQMYFQTYKALTTQWNREENSREQSELSKES